MYKLSVEWIHLAAQLWFEFVIDHRLCNFFGPLDQYIYVHLIDIALTHECELREEFDLSVHTASLYNKNNQPVNAVQYYQKYPIAILQGKCFIGRGDLIILNWNYNNCRNKLGKQWCLSKFFVVTYSEKVRR